MGNFGIRNHFWPLESRFFMRKSEKKGPNGLIYIFWNPFLFIFLWTKIKKNFKIGPLGPKEKINFFSFFLMRKRLSSGQKWFLRPHFPLIRSMFVFRRGLRFSFRALEVTEPRARKKGTSFSESVLFFQCP